MLAPRTPNSGAFKVWHRKSGGQVLSLGGGGQVGAVGVSEGHRSDLLLGRAGRAELQRLVDRPQGCGATAKPRVAWGLGAQICAAERICGPQQKTRHDVDGLPPCEVGGDQVWSQNENRPEPVIQSLAIFGSDLLARRVCRHAVSETPLLILAFMTSPLGQIGAVASDTRVEGALGWPCGCHTEAPRLQEQSESKYAWLFVCVCVSSSISTTYLCLHK